MQAKIRGLAQWDSEVNVIGQVRKGRPVEQFNRSICGQVGTVEDWARRGRKTRNEVGEEGKGGRGTPYLPDSLFLIFRVLCLLQKSHLTRFWISKFQHAYFRKRCLLHARYNLSIVLCSFIFCMAAHWQPEAPALKPEPPTKFTRTLIARIGKVHPV
jgi:hypothetical protein